MIFRDSLNVMENIYHIGILPVLTHLITPTHPNPTFQGFFLDPWVNSKMMTVGPTSHPPKVP